MDSNRCLPCPPAAARGDIVREISKLLQVWLNSHENEIRGLTLRSDSPTLAPVDSATRFRQQNGEVSEWLKEHAWKVCIRESVSRVRTPLSPPNLKRKPGFASRLFFAWCTAERGEKPRQGSTKCLRFGPPTAARRGSAANQSLPHRHILRRSLNSRSGFFVCMAHWPGG